jgi:glycosyltransferase involved in cell wall biosynthesis
MTRVDVIVPCYNYGDMLDACVRSVLSQEEVDVRVLIMDDASTDSTEQVGRHLAATDPRVEYRRHLLNRGHIATYNEGLAEVTAEYCVLPLSADDLLTPGSLRRATHVMAAHPTVGLTYGRDITFRGAPPHGAARRARDCSHQIMSYGDFLERSCRLGETGIQAATAVVRTSLHRKVGGYLPELPHSADTEIWLRMAAHAAVCELDADQAFRRLHDKNMSLGYSPVRRLEEQKKAFDVHFEAYRRERPEIAALEPVLDRTIAEAAVWSGGRAFDAGDGGACDEFLSFASRICPDVESSLAWRRLRVKRWIGPTAWRRLEPVASFLRNPMSFRANRHLVRPPAENGAR